MKIFNLFDAKKSFHVFATAESLQTAAIVLEPGESTSQAMSRHRDSEQILLVVEGELKAEIEEETERLKRGDIVIVPKNAPHRFANSGNGRAVAFTAYAPPAY